MAALTLTLSTGPTWALDPPHNVLQSIDCSSCHTLHGAPGGALTTVKGNPNLCQSCHNDQGPASALPMDDADQALPGPGLPAGVIPQGFSHRWDSGPSGHVVADALNSSSGTVQSGGAFEGPYPKTYTITITTPGDVGVATFSWSDTAGGGTCVTSADCPGGFGYTCPAGQCQAPTGTDVFLPDTCSGGDDDGLPCVNDTECPNGGTCGGITVTFSDGASAPSFVLGDEWNVYVRTDITDVANLANPAIAQRMFDGKVSCSACHDQHSQAATPFDPDAPAYAGAGTGAQCVGGSNDGLICAVASDCPGGECRRRHFQRVSNDVNEMCLDCHSARDVALSSQGSHPVGVTIPATAAFTTPSALPLDAANQVACMSCHTPHYAPTSDGSLTRDGDIVALCTDCHAAVDTVTGSHFDPTGGALWPGGQYGTCTGGTNDGGACAGAGDCPGGGTCGGITTFPAKAASERGNCTNCHQPHGWPNAASPRQDYATLLVAHQAQLCFTCHDGDPVTTTANVFDQFNGATNYRTTAGDGALVNQRHDVSVTDQAYSGGAVGCANCHNPHYVAPGERVMDPDDPSVVFTSIYSWDNSYTRQGWNFTYYGTTSDLDPMNPIGCVAQAASIGPAIDQEPAIGGNDTGQSNEAGTYTGTEDQIYTVLVSTGGAPGTAQITVTSTGADSSGPTTVPAFGTPVPVGSFGVTITFTDIGTPSSINPATCSTSCSDDTATSSGTYTGPANGTYTLSVTTAGAAGTAVITCTSGISGDACNPSTTYVWPGNGTAISIGSYGVQVTINDADATAKRQDLAVGEAWQIPVTAALAGDGQLAVNDRWTIAVTAATAGCSTDAEPDMVEFCLVCHDCTPGGDCGTTRPPPAGVTMSPNLVNIANAYATADQHGRIAGNNGGNGFMKAPWQDLGGQQWANSELPNPYASLQCTSCHDGHGTDNIFHLKSSITIRGQVMAVGGGPGSGFEANPFTPESDHGPGDEVYTLPCFSGSSQVTCDTPGSAQVDHKWGAFCTFCHDMQTHGQAEDNTCRTGHKHGGGAF